MAPLSSSCGGRVTLRTWPAVCRSTGVRSRAGPPARGRFRIRRWSLESILVFDERQGVQVKDRDGPGWIAATFGEVDPSQAKLIENPGIGDGGHKADLPWVIYQEGDRAGTPRRFQVALAVAASRRVRASATTLCGFTVRSRSRPGLAEGRVGGAFAPGRALYRGQSRQAERPSGHSRPPVVDCKRNGRY
jgi:hypothetical protein